MAKAKKRRREREEREKARRKAAKEREEITDPNYNSEDEVVGKETTKNKKKGKDQ